MSLPLSNTVLFEAYEKAKELDLSDDFIQILEEEILKRTHCDEISD